MKKLKRFIYLIAIILFLNFVGFTFDPGKLWAGMVELGENLFSPHATTGYASFYADKYVGRRTSNGEIFVQDKLTAAHNTLPFGSEVKVTNLDNGKSVIVVVNDRGPFAQGRIIDLSKAAARKIDMTGKGIVKVNIEVVN